MTTATKDEWGFLKIVTCLQILLFEQMICSSVLQTFGVGVKNLIFFYGPHK